MKQEDLMRFTEILSLVAEQYNKTVSDGLVALYWQGLKDYDFPAVQDAFTRHLRNPDNGQFMPKIADIIRMMHGTSLDSALVAWSKIDKAVRLIGPYVDVVFDDPIIHRVLTDMGGWISLGTKTDDEWPFVAKEFENRYKGLKAHGMKIEYPKVLVGIAGAHNEKEGFKVEPPTLIGNLEKANQVLLNGTERPALEFTKLSAISIAKLENAHE